MTTETVHTDVQKKGGFVKWAMIVAIVIVLNMFFNYAVSLVYKAPQYDDYIKTTQIVTPITNKDACVAVGGQWTDGVKVPTDPKSDIAGYCDPNYTNQNNFYAAEKNYNRNIFIILVVLSVLSLVLGTLFKNEILAPAFSWGGVLSLVIASTRYWGDANDLFKVVILALALGLLVWFAIKKFN